MAVPNAPAATPGVPGDDRPPMPPVSEAQRRANWAMLGVLLIVAIVIAVATPNRLIPKKLEDMQAVNQKNATHR